jgi:hypothetical protein
LAVKGGLDLIKDKIKNEMKKIATRRVGRKRLIFRKETKTIWEVNQKGEYIRDTGIKASDN